MLGFSYVVMQTAVENNYLPNAELTNLLEYAAKMDTDNSFSQKNTSIIMYFNPNDSNDASMDHRVRISPTNDVMGSAGIAAGFGDPYGDASKRKQYGKASRVGVYTEYTVIWPLDYRDTIVQGGVAGYAPDGSGGSGAVSFENSATLEAMRDREFHQGDANPSGQIGGKVVIPIRIVYTVPGLKYYPDLINY